MNFRSLRTTLRHREVSLIQSSISTSNALNLLRCRPVQSPQTASVNSCLGRAMSSLEPRSHPPSIRFNRTSHANVIPSIRNFSMAGYMRQDAQNAKTPESIIDESDLALDRYDGNIMVITMKKAPENRLNSKYAQKLIATFNKIRQILGTETEGAVITRGNDAKFWCTVSSFPLLS